MRFRLGVFVGGTCLLFAVAIWGHQFGDRNEMNGMPFAKVKSLMADPGKARQMAQQGNIDLFVGDGVGGREVKLHGELTDANCFLSKGVHAYDHAFCAKACVAAGSPIIFIADDGGIYFVITPRNGVLFSEEELNSLGVPGITVQGRIFRAYGRDVLAIESAE